MSFFLFFFFFSLVLLILSSSVQVFCREVWEFRRSAGVDAMYVGYYGTPGLGTGLTGWDEVGMRTGWEEMRDDDDAGDDR